MTSSTILNEIKCPIALTVSILAICAVYLIVQNYRKNGQKEGYSPPPGFWRALSPDEMPDPRGWTSYSKVYEGSSAGSMNQFTLRSA